MVLDFRFKGIRFSRWAAILNTRFFGKKQQLRPPKFVYRYHIYAMAKPFVLIIALGSVWDSVEVDRIQIFPFNANGSRGADPYPWK